MVLAHRLYTLQVTHRPPAWVVRARPRATARAYHQRRQRPGSHTPWRLPALERAATHVATRHAICTTYMYVSPRESSSTDGVGVQHVDCTHITVRILLVSLTQTLSRRPCTHEWGYKFSRSTKHHANCDGPCAPQTAPTQANPLDQQHHAMRPDSGQVSAPDGN